MKHRMFVALGLGGVAAMTLSVIGVVPAGADYAPQPGDVVGVGGDTPQYALTFLSNGDTKGDLGFNSTGDYNRLVTFNAVADGNGRSAYAQNSTPTHLVPLNPTDVLRAGTVPVQRVQASGTSITALLADTHTPEQINFIFSASLPSPAQVTTAINNGWGGLNAVEIGTDAIKLAEDDTTNVPANLTTADLYHIYNGTYTQWKQIPTYSGTHGTTTIVAEIPPSGSSVYKKFVTKLGTVGTVSISTHVKVVQQNDPTAITSLVTTTAANAIVPFSTARLKLYTSGYFHTPTTKYPGSSTAISPGIQFNTGATALDISLKDYVIYRTKDATSTTPFEPGSSLNWVEALFANTHGTPYVDSAAGQALINASGATAAYVNLGPQPS